jgi:hypothetical protein
MSFQLVFCYFCYIDFIVGRNSYEQGKKVPHEAEDGLLHSFDTRLLMLYGSKVVCSACETGTFFFPFFFLFFFLLLATRLILFGLGVAQKHWLESAAGMRGGFLAAGASCVIVSICKVHDTITTNFMHHLYVHPVNLFFLYLFFIFTIIFIIGIKTYE